MAIPTSFKILVNGGPGTGKTTFGLTFPAVAYIGTEPNGLDILRSNPKLKPNLAMSEEFLPSPIEDIKDTFIRMSSYIKSIHLAAKEGKVKTLFLDNLTYLSMNRWLWMETYGLKKTEKGEIDTRGMYGALGLWLYGFLVKEIVSFPGHLIIAAHEQKDDENDLKKALNPEAPVTPDVLGSTRYRVSGLVSASIYLKRSKVAGGFKFSAQCIEGNQKAAKNRYGLPEVVENISYQALVDYLASLEVKAA